MVYSFINYDLYNKNYKKIIKIALSNSDCFGFFTSKHIRKKDHPDSYFEFLDNLSDYLVACDDINVPRYTSGQQFHCYNITKNSRKIIDEPIDFGSWDGYAFPEDLTFYFNKKPWLRCISHERIVLINEINIKAFEEIKKLGLTFSAIKDGNSI